MVSTRSLTERWRSSDTIRTQHQRSMSFDCRKIASGSVHTSRSGCSIQQSAHRCGWWNDRRFQLRHCAIYAGCLMVSRCCEHHLRPPTLLINKHGEVSMSQQTAQLRLYLDEGLWGRLPEEVNEECKMLLRLLFREIWEAEHQEGGGEHE